MLLVALTAAVLCTFKRFAPGPCIVRFLLITICPLVILIGLTTVDMSNVIVLPGQASMIAWRKLPAPASLLFNTTGSITQQPTTAIKVIGFPKYVVLQNGLSFNLTLIK